MKRSSLLAQLPNFLLFRYGFLPSSRSLAIFAALLLSNCVGFRQFFAPLISCDGDTSKVRKSSSLWCMSLWRDITPPSDVVFKADLPETQNPLLWEDHFWSKVQINPYESISYATGAVRTNRGGKSGLLYGILRRGCFAASPMVYAAGRFQSPRYSSMWQTLYSSPYWFVSNASWNGCMYSLLTLHPDRPASQLDVTL